MFSYDAENSIAQYSFIEGNEDHVFGLDHINGRIFVMGELRYTKQSVGTLFCYASFVGKMGPSLLHDYTLGL